MKEEEKYQLKILLNNCFLMTEIMMFIKKNCSIFHAAHIHTHTLIIYNLQTTRRNIEDGAERTLDFNDAMKIMNKK